MSKTFLCFVFILVAMGTYNNCDAQFEICTIPKVTFIPTFDGEINETENDSIWGLVSSRPLRFFVRPEDEWEWSNDWPDVTQGYTKDDIWVYWNAVWNGNEIYFFITMEDDTVDADHREHKIPNFDEDDSIHLWSEDNENGIPSQDFAKVLNYLFHNDITDTFFVQQIDGTFDTVDVNDANSKVEFGKLNNNPTWFVESAITSSDGNSYEVDNSLWFNFIYNDADGKVNPSDLYNNRKLKLAWNGHSYVAPWETPGLLILGPKVTAKEEIVYKENQPMLNNVLNDSQLNLTKSGLSHLDGKLDEEEYKHIAPIILTSSRAPQLNDSLWTFWTHPSDAAVIFRSFWAWGYPEDELYLGIEIFDNSRDNNNAVDSLRNFIQDDGLHIWIDFDRDNRYTLNSDDINILIHNNGNIYQKIDTSSYENFDSLFTNPNVQVAIGQLGQPTNWIAEVMVKIPDIFFEDNPDNMLPIEIGYNDADDKGYREHQLVWNNVNYGGTPWNNFSNLGYLKLSEKNVYTDEWGPEFDGAPIDIGSYTSITEVTFNWPPANDPYYKSDYGTGVSTYHLQVGTIQNPNDIFDKWIGDTLRYVVTGSHGQTLYARVQAQDRAGNIGNWSASSDGITIDITSPSFPGKPRIVPTNNDSVSFTWSCASDDESGIIDYQLQIIAAIGDSNIFNKWIESNDTTFTLHNPDDLILHARVRAMNGAGSIGGWSNWSNGITILPIDIIFAFDLSENMADNMEAIKQAVTTAMNRIITAGIDAYFGVASFVDYPGSYNSCNYSAQYGAVNDFPWKIDQELTNDTSLVKIAIDDLQTYSGADGPQAYTRDLLECLFLNWRSESRKFVIIIGNAPAHDCDFFSTSYGKDPGPDAQMNSWDDLDYETVVDWVNRAGISIISLDNGTATDSTLDYAGDVWKNFEYMAAKTGGKHVIKDSLHQIPSALEQLIAQGPKPDSLYPWIAEAEEMLNREPYYGRPCDDGWKLTHSDQPIYSGVVFLKDSLYQFTIRAKAEIANQAVPWLLVQVGNGFKGTCEIKSTEWQDYTFVAAIPKGYHCLSLTFLNDWWNPYNGDRNLLIDNVTIQYHAGKTDTTAYVFEAEEMSHHSEGSSQVGEYWKLDKRYAYIAHDYYFEKQELKCEIFAKADSAAGGWPSMDICLDENMINSFSFSDTGIIGYQFTLTGIQPEKHRIKIAYNNEHYHRGRNLYIDKLIIYVNDGGLLKSINEKAVEEQAKPSVPDKYELDQNYPNPFNPDTYIKYQIPEDTHVSIKIFNTMGQEIRTLVNQNRAAGYYTVHWDGLDNQGNHVGSGIYVYQIKAERFVCTRKLVLLK